ncbi:hypothetical protein LR48_Vigan08g211200 [Vigna angularis]|uniref:DUF7610 domain-containing protein n=1 Tax=Phaseolus angularis TaxID=3914 RepID=A0A0L9V874_PHAAN|nr:uncharacterized protein HKW66_Vig0135130 [Vigna angularis]KOM51285.1 hypothetical protein LR48_Vigan08g211200 [Vigna angularis]
MTKSCKRLQEKLEELQGMLEEALLLGPETHSHDSISRVIKQKLAFVNNLLNAELASHSSPPPYLNHISERLFALQRNFNKWDSFRSVQPGHDMDKDSTSSHTDSCVNDDGEALNETGMVGFEDPEKVCLHSNEKGEVTDCDEEEKETGELKNGSDNLVSSDYEEAEEFFEEFAGEKELVEFEGNDLEKEARRESTSGERCGALICGVVIGMILMIFIIFMLNTSDWFYHTEELSFAVPT